MYCPETKEKDSNNREYMNETTQKMMNNWKFSTNEAYVTEKPLV